MKNPFGRITQLLPFGKRLLALTDKGTVYEYLPGALKDGADGWEPLSDLVPDNLVPGDGEEEDEEDESDED